MASATRPEPLCRMRRQRPAIVQVFDASCGANRNMPPKKLRHHGGGFAAAPLPLPVRLPTLCRICERYGQACRGARLQHSMATQSSAAEGERGGGDYVLTVQRQGVRCPHGWLPPAPYSSSSSAMLCGEPPQTAAGRVELRRCRLASARSLGGPLDVLQGPRRRCCALHFTDAPCCNVDDLRLPLPSLYVAKLWKGVWEPYAPRPRAVTVLSATVSRPGVQPCCTCGFSRWTTVLPST